MKNFFITAFTKSCPDGRLEFIGAIIAAVIALLTLIFSVKSINKQIKSSQKETNEQMKASRESTFDNNKYIQFLKEFKDCINNVENSKFSIGNMESELTTIFDRINIFSNSKYLPFNGYKSLKCLNKCISDISKNIYEIGVYYEIWKLPKGRNSKDVSITVMNDVSKKIVNCNNDISTLIKLVKKMINECDRKNDIIMIPINSSFIDDLKSDLKQL